MNARIAGHLPSPIGCVFRRCLAKVVDVVLFGFISYFAAYLIQLGTWRFDALVPAFISVFWVLGFIITLDLAFVLVLGSTPGEILARIRVRTLDDERLSYSQRQGRTQDALVEGTLGCYSLLSQFWHREPAAYDAGCTIWFDQITRLRLLVTALLLASVLAILTVCGAALGLYGIESYIPVKVIQGITLIGFNPQQRWVNPLSGKTVVLPWKWRVVNTTYMPSKGVMCIDFSSWETEDPWLVELIIIPDEAASVLYLPDFATNKESLDFSLGYLNFPYAEESLDLKLNITGEQRLNQLYSAQLTFDEHSSHMAGTAIAWFTNGKDAWAVGFVHSVTGSPKIRDEGYRLAFGLIQSTGFSQ